jgi:hypothetical protein
MQTFILIVSISYRVIIRMIVGSSKMRRERNVANKKQTKMQGEL